MCGTTRKVGLHCDPILKLPKKDASAKKYIRDQIINILSEATTGKNFIVSVVFSNFI